MKSQFEIDLAAQLKKAKVSFAYEAESLKYIVEGKYKPDFIVDFGSEKIYIEGKGFLKPSDRVKMEAVKKAHPNLDIRFVFQQNNFVYKKKKGEPRRTPESTDMRYGDWCDKHGFPWAVGKIPDDWLLKKTSRNRRSKSKNKSI